VVQKVANLRKVVVPSRTTKPLPNKELYTPPMYVQTALFAPSPAITCMRVCEQGCSHVRLLHEARFNHIRNSHTCRTANVPVRWLKCPLKDIRRSPRDFYGDPERLFLDFIRPTAA